MSNKLTSENYIKKKFYYIFFCIVIIVIILLDFLVTINLILPINIIYIALAINLTAVIYLSIKRSFIKRHPIFVSYSFIFMVLPWLIYIKALYKNQGLISLVLHDSLYFTIFLGLIPIIIGDNYMFNRVNFTPGDRMVFLKRIIPIKDKVYYLIFIMISIADYFLIWYIYYNLIYIIQFIGFLIISTSTVIIYLALNISFIKENLIFTIYSFSVIIFPWFLFIGWLTEKDLIITYIETGLLFAIFLWYFIISIPIIGVFQCINYNKKIK